MIAVDLGNTRMKLGRFARDGRKGDALPEPVATFDVPISHESGEFDTQRLIAWCEEFVSGQSAWLVASVHRGAADRLDATVAEWAQRSGVECPIRRLTYRDVPLEIRVDAPERVGIDRLVAAVAADRLRRPDRAVIVVDAGTAITVDLLDQNGAFCGGAILPGIAMSARALAEQTDALPRVALDHLGHPPAALGKSTMPAIESGLYWGAVGAIRELIHQLAGPLGAPPDVLLTGGASPDVADILAASESWSVRHVPHLVLSGIALVSAT
jgi:type III pantothenate kinase